MDENRVKESLGTICWLEIPVKDVSRAQTFYTDIFGWDFPNASSSDPAESPSRSLHFFNKGEALNGAFVLDKDGHQVINHDPSRPQAAPLLPTINVVDCADTLRKAEAIGGKIGWPKTEIGGGMGFFARLIDTEGNMIGIWSYK